MYLDQIGNRVAVDLKDICRSGEKRGRGASLEVSDRGAAAAVLLFLKAAA
jgi:hypothetical protein